VEVPPVRPVIAVPCYSYGIKRGGAVAPVYAANKNYMDAIEEAGGAPVLVPLYAERDTLASLRGRFDGLLLTGGGDVDPARYGERPIPETEPPSHPRDEVEISIVADALAERIPVLGICRGIQLLNVARGGTLYQDIRVQIPGARNHNLNNRVRGIRTHPVSITPGSLLASVTGVTEHTVNSFHHQALKDPGTGVSIIARAPDGVAEALEIADYSFALAVQFHPERMYTTDPVTRRLFEAFVAACRDAMRPHRESLALAATR
jgi:putative glutamine amidotransferase